MYGFFKELFQFDPDGFVCTLLSHTRIGSWHQPVQYKDGNNSS